MLSGNKKKMKIVGNVSLGSTSIITDKDGVATQFVAYMPYGEDATPSTGTTFSLSGNVGFGDDHADHTYMDINGDGLQDRVYSDGRVALNLGYSFAQPEPWGFSTIHSGSSISYGAGLGVSLWHGSFQAGIGLSRNDNRTGSRLIDVNGDGLPDKVEVEFDSEQLIPLRTVVRLNTGNGFADPVTWPDAYSVGESVSSGQSANIGSTFGFSPFLIPIKFIFSPSAFGNMGRSYDKSALIDFDGDGLPDCVYSDSEDEIRVKRSTIGRTNLLRSVQRPFGANFTLDYRRVGNTYDQPHSQWALAEVKSFDGYRGDGVDSTYTTFNYEGGYYDRNERSFYGYAKVTTRQHNMGEIAHPEYRRTEQTFDNHSYYTKGQAQTETLIAGSDTLTRSVNGYELRDIQTGEALPNGFKTYDNGAAFMVLHSTQNSQYESGEKITSTQTFGYDLLGNITNYVDYAAGNPADRVEVKITYHDNNALYLKAIPKAQQVITREGVMRERETAIDGRGNMTKITQAIDTKGNKAVYDFEYDVYGNLSKVTRPANYKGQRMYFSYEYDPVLHALPTKIKDAFGYESSSSYEYRFATLTETTDMNKNRIQYTTDNRGRVSTITAPNELTAGKPYTIKFEYVTDVVNPYAVTHHAMPEGNEILTYTFVDGLMRPLQVKKTGSLFTGEGQADKTAMIVSGWNIYDGFGRTIETYQSVVEELGNETKINTGRNPIAPTKTTYDTMDRPITVTLPDGAVSKSSTQITQNTQINTDDWLVENVQIDPLGRITKAYTDVKKRQRAAVQMLNGEEVITQSRYNALGEVLEVENAKGEITHYIYDLLGRKLSVNHPDAGLTEFEYDNANNLLKKVTPNLRAISNEMFIEYKYDYSRLSEIVYPKNVQNYVQYTYGEPNAPFNRAGRLVLVQDASGGQEFFYDELGNVNKSIRSILVSGSDLRTYVSENRYDSWGRQLSMTYPDGEVVGYEYNAAGNLRSMYSDKDNRHYEIVKQLGYNEDEQRVFKLLGNGTRTTYTYEPERKRLATMFTGKDNVTLFDNKYSYDLVDNILGIENNAAIPVTGLGGKTSNSYQYDDWNRLISATGNVQTKNHTGDYSLEMQYDKLYNITRKNQQNSIDEKKNHDWEYRYEDSEHPNAPSSIGSKLYQYDANGNPIVVNDTISGDYRRMIWDEENRLMLLSDNGNGNNYIYDHTGERVIKAQTGLQSVYIDGLAAGMLQSNKNFTIYVSPNMVVKNDGFTKHYYAGTERVLSKLGTGEFNNRFSTANPVITAGNQNYIQRQAQLQQGLNEYYRELQIPPGPPTQKATLGQPETTGQPMPTVVGNYEVPRGWPKEPIFNPPGGPPGPPIQLGEAITNDNVKAGYSYKPNSFEESDRYFYHPDHLGSTSIITDKDGVATQFVAYMPYGESLVDEHSSRKEMPYKFSGKEKDEETGLSYFGARYYDPAVAMWYGVDKLMEKYPNVGSYVYCSNSPINKIDPDGRREWPVDETYNGHTRRHENNYGAARGNRTHQGVDINLGSGSDDLGAPVLATHDGTVTRLATIDGDDTNAGGNRVQITSTNGEVSTYYMHLEGITEGLAVGSVVTEGTQIGTLGGSGSGSTDAYTPHLHYELTMDGQRVNPATSATELVDPQARLNPIPLPEVTVIGTAPAPAPLPQVQVPEVRLPEIEIPRVR